MPQEFLQFLGNLPTVLYCLGHDGASLARYAAHVLDVGRVIDVVILALSADPAVCWPNAARYLRRGWGALMPGSITTVLIKAGVINILAIFVFGTLLLLFAFVILPGPAPRRRLSQQRSA